MNKELIIGQVQSGKTRWIEKNIEYRWKENSDRIAIIFGGNTVVLFEQTLERMKKRFTTHTVQKFNKNLLPGTINVVLKQINHLKDFFNLLKQKEYDNKIIDIYNDESDYAYVDDVDGINEKKIEKFIQETMRNGFLNDLTYYHITATPFKDINLAIKSEKNRFHYIQQIKPHEYYCGFEWFISNNRYIVYSDENDYKIILEQALDKWIKDTCSAYKIDNNFNSQFLINCEIINEKQKELAQLVCDLILNQKFASQLRAVGIEHQVKIKTLNKTSKAIINTDKFEVIVSGFSASRGLTFDNLITTLFLRCSETPKLDTSLQQCRWFGPLKKPQKNCENIENFPIRANYATVFINKSRYDFFNDHKQEIINFYNLTDKIGEYNKWIEDNSKWIF